MDPRTLYIDARARTAEVGPATPVAGVPLVARHARLAGRLGIPSVRVLCADAAGRAEVERAFAFRPPPPSVSVEILVGEEAPRGAEVVPVLTVNTRNGAAMERITDVATRADLKAAEVKLFAALRKSVEHDGWFAYHLQRPVARVATRALLGTRMTPNQVTLTAMFCGLTAAVLAALGGWLLPAVAGLVFWTGAVIDCVDGELARLRLEGSKLGEWLDSIADDFSTMGIQVGLGIGLGRDGFSSLWPALGYASGVGVVCVAVGVYSTLHRRGLPIDTAVFPWWFGNPARKREDEPKTALGQVWGVFEMISRRDAWSTFLVFWLAFGWRKFTLGLLATATFVFFILFIINAVIMAARSAPSKSSNAG